MSLADLVPIRELREREAHLFTSVRPRPDAKRIILYSMDTWQLGVFEHFLHLAFVRRGHRPKTICYDGVLPICAWENGIVRPPPLEKQIARARFMCAAFGIVPAWISQYLDAATGDAIADAVVGGLPDAALPEASFRGVNIGRIAQRDLFQYTLGHFEPDTPDRRTCLRRHLRHAVMSVELAHRILDVERPDVVVLVNGKSVMYSYLYEVCRRRGVRVTTWEEGMYDDTSVVLAHDDRAIDFPVDPDAWARWRRRPLAPEDAAAVEDYFRRWRRQEATAYVYYEREITDFERIRRELEIPPGRRLVSIFTNIVWDTNALEKDDAFESMMDWVFTTIEYCRELPNTTLVIRAHPGEVRWAFRTRTPVRAMVLQRCCGHLPPHVRIVDGRSELSSYVIAARSERCAVYTSTLGVELALMGLRPLVCGMPFYSRKGFTHDVRSKEEYRALLHGQWEPKGGKRELLLRFLHLVLFQLIKKPEFFIGIHDTPQRPRVRIETFRRFPESMPVFNDIVECILNHESFIPL